MRIPRVIQLLGLALGFAAPAFAESTPAGAPAEVNAAAAAGNVLDISDLKKLRDPFKRPQVEIRAEEPKTELEMNPAESYKLIAILTGPKRTRAMLRGPDGKTHLVSAGAKIGTHNGVISRIDKNRVLVREKSVDLVGDVQFMDLEIPLQGPAAKKDAAAFGAVQPFPVPGAGAAALPQPGIPGVPLAPQGVPAVLKPNLGAPVR